MKMKDSLIALHGFLGRPTDWDLFGFDNLVGVDLFDFNRPHSLTQWAESFNAEIHKSHQHPLLMGYSLGGRLALHALINSPDRWRAAVIISAHPGLADQDTRQQRRLSDAEWAERFKTEDWNVLMQDWNGRAVFDPNGFAFDRCENHYQRKQLSGALTHWSLGEQEDLRDKIANLPMPILWIVGENDPTYRALAASVTFANPQSRLWVVQQASHRAPWEQPKAFTQQIQAFASDQY